jgi:hypothetical protein
MFPYDCVPFDRLKGKKEGWIKVDFKWRNKSHPSVIGNASSSMANIPLRIGHVIALSKNLLCLLVVP